MTSVPKKQKNKNVVTQRVIKKNRVNSCIRPSQSEMVFKHRKINNTENDISHTYGHKHTTKYQYQVKRL